MTTLAKIEANKRNAAFSTGPRTAEGKAAVARNATRHGIFAAVPVIPGESAEQWEAHRAGVVESLAPVGLLETNLAERAALLLWRLQRLARYESGTVTTGMEEVDVPLLPPPEDEFGSLNEPPKQKTRDEQLRDIRRALRAARRELAGVEGARDFLCPGPGARADGADGPVPYGVAESVLETAYSHAAAAEDLRSDPPEFESRAFLRRLGQAGSDPRKVTWTPELIERGLAIYAAFSGESPEDFHRAVEVEIGELTEDLARTVRRLEGEDAAITRLLDDGRARKRAEELLPSGGRDERIAKYERHLHNLLTSTLHELERLQARRQGEPITAPAVADVNVRVENEAV